MGQVTFGTNTDGNPLVWNPIAGTASAPAGGPLTLSGYFNVTTSVVLGSGGPAGCGCCGPCGALTFTTGDHVSNNAQFFYQGATLDSMGHLQDFAGAYTLAPEKTYTLDYPAGTGNFAVGFTGQGGQTQITSFRATPCPWDPGMVVPLGAAICFWVPRFRKKLLCRKEH